MRQRYWILWLVLCLVVTPLLVGATSTRGYGSGKYALELDGVIAGWLSSAEGGNAVGDVISEKVGGDRVARKHIGNVKYEEITLTFDASMSGTLYQWIKDSFDGKATRKSGAIIAADYDFKEQSRLTFTNAMLTEVGFPALDAASKDAAKMTIKIAPEYTRTVSKSRGNAIAATSKKQKQWMPSNFRLKIDGLDGPTSRVSKIDPLTIKLSEDRSKTGELMPTSMEVPNLSVAVGDLDGDGFFTWAEQSFTNQTDRNEKNGSLAYLDTSGQPLFTLTFTNLGIFRVAPDKMEAGVESIRRVKAEMYCEEMRFSYAAAN